MLSDVPMLVCLCMLLNLSVCNLLVCFFVTPFHTLLFFLVVSVNVKGSFD